MKLMSEMAGGGVNLLNAEEQMRKNQEAAREKAKPIAALLKQVAGSKMQELISDYALHRYHEQTDHLETIPLIKATELAAISDDPVRYVLLMQLMLADEADWIWKDAMRGELLTPFVPLDEDLEDRESLSDEGSNDETISFGSEDIVEAELPSDEVGSNSSSQQVAAGTDNGHEDELPMERTPRLSGPKVERKKMKKKEREQEVAAFEKKLAHYAKNQTTLSDDEWQALLKRAQTYGMYDCLARWVGAHADLVTLQYLREFFDLLFAEEWTSEADFELAGVPPMKRWHEPDSYLCKAIKEAIRVYALEEQDELLAILHEQLRLGVGKPYELLIVKLSNCMYRELTGKNKTKSKASMKRAVDRLDKVLLPEIKDEKPVIANFVREVLATRNMKEWLFESSWSYPKSFFYLLLNLTYTYSQKLADEVSFLIPDAPDGDLAEIMRLALERRFKRQPQYESDLCKLLSDAVDLQGDKPLRDLTAELGNLIFEADPDNNSDPEIALEAGPALECLRTILDQQGGDIKDEQLLAAFAYGWGARIEDNHFADLAEVAKNLDCSFGNRRLETSRSCMTLLEDWAYVHYENLTEEAMGTRDIRRLTERAFRYIRSAKTAALLEMPEKRPDVKVSDRKVARIENKGKLTAAFIEGTGGFMGDPEYVARWMAKIDKIRAEKEAKEQERLAKIIEAKRYKFTDRRQTRVLSPVAVASVLPISAVKGAVQPKNSGEAKSVKDLMQDHREDEDMVSAFSKRKIAGEKQKPTSRSPRPTVAQSTTRQKKAPAVSLTSIATGEEAVIPQAPLKRVPSKMPPKKALPMPPQPTGEQVSAGDSLIDDGSMNGVDKPHYPSSVESSAIEEDLTASQIERRRGATKNDPRRRAVTIKGEEIAKGLTNTQSHEENDSESQ